MMQRTDYSDMTPEDVAALPLWKQVAHAICGFNRFGSSTINSPEQWVEFASNFDINDPAEIHARVMAVVNRVAAGR